MGRRLRDLAARAAGRPRMAPAASMSPCARPADVVDRWRTSASSWIRGGVAVSVLARTLAALERAGIETGRVEGDAARAATVRRSFVRRRTIRSFRAVR